MKKIKLIVIILLYTNYFYSQDSIQSKALTFRLVLDGDQYKIKKCDHCIQFPKGNETSTEFIHNEVVNQANEGFKPVSTISLNVLENKSNVEIVILFTKSRINSTYLSGIKNEILNEMRQYISAEKDKAVADINSQLTIKLKSINDACWNKELKQEIIDYVSNLVKLNYEELKKLIEAK